MLNNLKFYVVLSYILIPIALLFAFLDVVLFMTALANPSALIMVFVIACLVIYTFASFKFLKKGIEHEHVQSSKLKDWIKVNAYVSFFLCALFFINSISVLVADNATLMTFVNEFLQQQPNLPAEITNTMILSLLKGVSVFLLFSGIVGLVHIRTTLRLVREHDHLFE